MGSGGTTGGAGGITGAFAATGRPGCWLTVGGRAGGGGVGTMVGAAGAVGGVGVGTSSLAGAAGPLPAVVQVVWTKIGFWSPVGIGSAVAAR